MRARHWGGFVVRIVWACAADAGTLSTCDHSDLQIGRRGRSVIIAFAGDLWRSTLLRDLHDYCIRCSTIIADHGLSTFTSRVYWCIWLLRQTWWCFFGALFGFHRFRQQVFLNWHLPMWIIAFFLRGRDIVIPCSENNTELVYLICTNVSQKVRFSLETSPATTSSRGKGPMANFVSV